MLPYCSTNIKNESKGPIALVLVPTKELAEQVTQVFNSMITYCEKYVKAVNVTAGSEQVQKYVTRRSSLISEPNYHNLQK